LSQEPDEGILISIPLHVPELGDTEMVCQECEETYDVDEQGTTEFCGHCWRPVYDE